MKPKPELHAEVIRLRKFGYTYAAIGHRVGVSANRACQIVNRYANHLHGLMQDDVAAELERIALALDAISDG